MEDEVSRNVRPRASTDTDTDNDNDKALRVLKSQLELLQYGDTVLVVLMRRPSAAVTFDPLVPSNWVVSEN